MIFNKFLSVADLGNHSALDLGLVAIASVFLSTCKVLFCQCCTFREENELDHPSAHRNLLADGMNAHPIGMEFSDSVMIQFGVLGGEFELLWNDVRVNPILFSCIWHRCVERRDRLLIDKSNR